MNEIKKLNKKYSKALKKVTDIENEIFQFLKVLREKKTKVRLTKKLAEWFDENGEECGVPYKQIDAIKKRPKCVIVDFDFHGGAIDIKVKFDLPDLEYLRVGFEDIE